MTIDVLVVALKDVWAKNFEHAMTALPDKELALVVDQLSEYRDMSQEELDELLSAAFSAQVARAAKQEALRRSRTG
jgi:PHD/YefM family antitoxin component YafN of YafNO toxin-antitoxin module